ncbi:MAG: metallophosphoesterase [Syntrophobacteraceae bacterium]
MKRFLLAFLLIYSLMNAFVYVRLKVLLPEWSLARMAAIMFMAFMVFAPVLTRLLERSGMWAAARSLGFVGFCWLGFLFYCFLGFLLVLAFGTVLQLLNLATGFCLPVLSGPATALSVLVLAVLINIYGFFEASSIRVERVVLESNKLPPGVDRVRIAQISDVHLGLMAAEKRMAKILDAVQAQGPDLLVSTGDLLDGKLSKREPIEALFAKVCPRLGKFAVTGNHEVYAGLDESIAAQRAFGFTVLRGEAKIVDNILTIAGVDDPAANHDGEETKILGGVQNGLFTLLLKHRPHPADTSLGLFDLQLSGHTHYGQLFPFRYIVALFYPFQNGPYYLPKGSVLYTSRGSGSWGLPVRVLARPEVTIIDVVASASKRQE